MTKDEAKELLEKLGMKVDEVSDELEAKITEWKSGLDAETRRAVRPYWIALAAITFLLGCGVGHFLL